MSLIGGSDREELKRELRAELRREERRRRALGCLGRILLQLAVILFAAFLAAAALAKSGWHEVPYLTGWLYRPAEPARAVLPISAVSDWSGEEADGVYVQTLKEGDLNADVVESILGEGNELLNFEVKEIQTVILPEGVEVFAVLVRPERDVTVRMMLEPRAEEGRLALGISGVSLGSLKIPDLMMRTVTKALAKQISEAIDLSEGGMGHLEEVRLRNGALDLVFTKQPIRLKILK